MSWLDRLTGADLAALPEGPTLPGRFMRRENGARHHPAAGAGAQADFLGELIPDDEQRELQVAVAGLAGASWDLLVATTPVARTDDIEVARTERDQLLQQAAETVERICRDPHSLLTTITELEPVHRVRRTRPAALAYLASHTEDWLHRGVVGVRPRRVLSERRDAVLDIYENRLVARLLDRVLCLLDRRLSELARLENLFEEVELNLATDSVSSGRDTKPWHWRARRLCEIWGDAELDDNRRDIARATRSLLELSRRRMAACRTSALYEAVPRGAGMDREPHATNVLRGERRYRAAREHWRLLQCPDAERQTPDTAADFDRFAALLVVRALAQLGFAEVDKRGSHSDGFVVASAAGPIEVSTGDTGVRITREGKLLVRLLPVPARIDALDEATLRKLDREVPEQERADTVLLYWETAARIVGTPSVIAGLAHDRCAGGIELGILPISPWDLGSVERVARALRWFVMRSVFTQFPPRLASPPVGLNSRPDQVTQIAGCLIAATLDVGEVDGWLRQLDGRRVANAKAREDAHAKYERARKENKDRRELERELDAAKDRLTQVERELEAGRAWREEFASARTIVNAVKPCPACGTPGEHPRIEAEAYTFVCDGCHTEWGVRRCTGCKTRLPFIAPPRLTAAEGKPVDVIFGQDVLAIFGTRGGSTCARCTKS